MEADNAIIKVSEGIVAMTVDKQTSDIFDKQLMKTQFWVHTIISRRQIFMFVVHQH